MGISIKIVSQVGIGGKHSSNVVGTASASSLASVQSAHPSFK